MAHGTTTYLPSEDGGAAKRPSVLIVDDIPENLNLISEMLAGLYRCRIATEGEKALTIARAEPQPDLLLLDIAMPGIDGYEVCRRLKADPRTADIPVIFLTSLDREIDETRGFEAGGADYITKPVSRAILLARVGAQITLLESRRLLARQNEELEAKVRERKRQLSVMQDIVVRCLASLAETRARDSDAHVLRVQHFTRALAVALRSLPGHEGEISDSTLDLLYKTSPLHDIGKVGVSDSVLFKPGKLTEAEYEAMKQHVLFGCQTLMEVERRLEAPEAFVSMAQDIAMYHHERWDGSGYPLGLSGENIPLSARLVGLADAYDALTSKKAYSPARPSADAARIIYAERGKQFDPAVVDAFSQCTQQFCEISAAFPDTEGSFPNSRARTS